MPADGKSHTPRRPARTGRIGSALLLTACFALTACKLLYLPPASWVVFPVAQFSDNSTHTPETARLIRGREHELKKLTLAVLSNRNRDRWSSEVDGVVVDEHTDENVLLADYLHRTGLFQHVFIIDRLESVGQDFTLSCSIDCLYNIDLDTAIWLLNCGTLGVGFLLGWPHQDSSAFYVAESIVYDHRGQEPVVVSGGITENTREWYCDNIFWRPDFYGPAALTPLFEHILYDFLTRAGWAAE